MLGAEGRGFLGSGKGEAVGAEVGEDHGVGRCGRASTMRERAGWCSEGEDYFRRFAGLRYFTFNARRLMMRVGRGAQIFAITERAGFQTSEDETQADPCSAGAVAGRRGGL
jgi:hypothetical protein